MPQILTLTSFVFAWAILLVGDGALVAADVAAGKTTVAGLLKKLDGASAKIEQKTAAENRDLTALRDARLGDQVVAARRKELEEHSAIYAKQLEAIRGQRAYVDDLRAELMLAPINIDLISERIARHTGLVEGLLIEIDALPLPLGIPADLRPRCEKLVREELKLLESSRLDGEFADQIKGAKREFEGIAAKLKKAAEPFRKELPQLDARLTKFTTALQTARVRSKATIDGKEYNVAELEREIQKDTLRKKFIDAQIRMAEQTPQTTGPLFGPGGGEQAQSQGAWRKQLLTAFTAHKIEVFQRMQAGKAVEPTRQMLADCEVLERELMEIK